MLFSFVYVSFRRMSTAPSQCLLARAGGLHAAQLICCASRSPRPREAKAQRHSARLLALAVRLAQEVGNVYQMGFRSVIGAALLLLTTSRALRGHYLRNAELYGAAASVLHIVCLGFHREYIVQRLVRGSSAATFWAILSSGQLLARHGRNSAWVHLTFITLVRRSARAPHAFRLPTGASPARRWGSRLRSPLATASPDAHIHLGPRVNPPTSVPHSASRPVAPPPSSPCAASSSTESRAR